MHPQPEGPSQVGDGREMGQPRSTQSLPWQKLIAVQPFTPLQSSLHCSTSVFDPDPSFLHPPLSSSFQILEKPYCPNVPQSPAVWNKLMLIIVCEEIKVDVISFHLQCVPKISKS